MKYNIKKLLINNFDVYEDNKLPGRSYFIPYTDKKVLSEKTAINERFGSDLVTVLSGEWNFKYYKQISRLPSIIDTENMIGSNFDSFKLCDMKLRLKAAKNHAALSAASSLSELSGAPFISWGEQSNMHKILIKVCDRAGFFPNIVASAFQEICSALPKNLQSKTVQLMFTSQPTISVSTKNTATNFSLMPKMSRVKIQEFIERKYNKSPENFGALFCQIGIYL